ncbi:MAG: TIGR03862 family flavoprotein [Alphaproteobacteria bacterium]|nr:TIGR03862 family flavoprotein [Alphaproteobacteria bacterium]MBU1515794.1 TIGR03862 family flavoprotein [Alphaproteobacteria bacterium]MBU2094016.1 TIGR03862 family flavoprotein [Alphaproteobacteria bacterium]MBU2152615.1 TIGR03862 family flavoprotein [Alphaproteobacteria bacterium]MBU2308838.1 TIGR03862 family flavoprotein [Alphaproteobacteria bacterium]
MAAVAVIGGGPAGLFAAETLAAAGHAVTVYDRMPSVGRKLLMAGRGGLNLTHSEDLEAFAARYGGAAARLRPMLDAFPPAALIAWAEGLGQPTFTGSSGRVFPRSLKASPLLRAWLARLAGLGVTIRTRTEWLGWADDGALRFRTPDGEIAVNPDATVLALGGASWPKLGSDGAWAAWLEGVIPFRPANMGFDVGWSPVMQGFAGQPLKNIALTFRDHTVRGEAMVTRHGLEGGALYALSAPLRDAVTVEGAATLTFDLRPEMTPGALTARLSRPKAAQSLSTHLRKALKLSPVEINLLREAQGKTLPTEPGGLARAIKAAPIRLTGVQPLARAISSAGGVAFATIDDDLMLKDRPGVFVAGEMLDWEAPTGGYLLQATFATGLTAARGVMKRLGAAPPS